jgi:hypothetical protein
MQQVKFKSIIIIIIICKLMFELKKTTILVIFTIATDLFS